MRPKTRAPTPPQSIQLKNGAMLHWRSTTTQQRGHYIHHFNYVPSHGTSYPLNVHVMPRKQLRIHAEHMPPMRGTNVVDLLIHGISNLIKIPVRRWVHKKPLQVVQHVGRPKPQVVRYHPAPKPK